MKSSLDLLHLAARAADRAGGYIRDATRGAHNSRAWESKGHHDWVTEVDRNAERMISSLLLSGAPGSRVIGEELAPDLALDGPVWIVDPLDGTTNFLHGYPQCAVSVALAVDGELSVAVILDVWRETVYGAVRGQGAWQGNQPLAVSSTSEPGRALLGTGFPFKTVGDLDAYLPQLRRVLPATSGVRRAGSAALDLVDVAAGRLDGFWELTLAPWDTAGGILMIREAGGVVTRLDGTRAGIEHGGLVAGNPAIHAWLLTQVGTA